MQQHKIAEAAHGRRRVIVTTRKGLPHSAGTSASVATASTEVPQKKIRKTAKKSASVALNDSNVDPFIGQIVGFYCASDIGKKIIESFGDQWTEAAICKQLSKEHGHVIGKVTRKSKAEGRKKSTATQCYDVAWEYTNLGESSVSTAYLLDASHVGTLGYIALGRVWPQILPQCLPRAEGVGQEKNRFI